jgi:hypothetical protein
VYDTLEEESGKCEKRLYVTVKWEIQGVICIRQKGRTGNKN